jgi:hypothetical protein
LKQSAAAAREIAFDASRLPGFWEAHLSLRDAEWRNMVSFWCGFVQQSKVILS